MDLTSELGRTNPDYVVYVPQSASGDTGNEHFLVFDHPDGVLRAIWTQSTFEGMPDQHIVFSRSKGRGAEWSPPVQLAGPDPSAGVGMASWAFPMVSRSGRIYVLYSRHIGINDYGRHTTGLMAGVCSDDGGDTWSEEQIIGMRRSRWDNPDADVPANWIVWQKPMRLAGDRYLAGFTRWVSKAIAPPPPIRSWIGDASVVEFMRFENLDEDPQVADLQISFLACDDDALQVPFPGHPDVSVVQEPSLIRLPDSRLFCVMRTAAGAPFWSVSSDLGDSWTQPLVLRQHDGGPVIPQPLSPCPLYSIDDRNCFLLVHNHDGHFKQWGPTDTSWHRRPICIAQGRFRPDAAQPVWFDEPCFLMDNGGTALGHGQGRSDLAMYASVTYQDGLPVLWYPERKYFLLGRVITAETLSAATGRITLTS
jgi:hypothetical protein